MSLSLSITSSFSSLITLILLRLVSSRLFLPFFPYSSLLVSQLLHHIFLLFIDYSHSPQTGLIPLILTFLPLVFSPYLSASLSHLPSLHWLLLFSPDWPHPTCSYHSSSSLLFMSHSLSITSSFSSLITLILPDWPCPASSYLSSFSLLYISLILSITSSFSSLITLILPWLASFCLFFPFSFKLSLHVSLPRYHIFFLFIDYPHSL